MTLREFIDKNKDLLLKEITPAKLFDLGTGQPVFYISVHPSNKPKLDRNVSDASHSLVVHTTVCPNSPPEDIVITGITKGGYARFNYITPDDLTKNDTKMLFLTKPIPTTDPRFNKRWVDWPT